MSSGGTRHSQGDNPKPQAWLPPTPTFCEVQNPGTASTWHSSLETSCVLWVLHPTLLSHQEPPRISQSGAPLLHEEEK